MYWPAPDFKDDADETKYDKDYSTASEEYMTVNNKMRMVRRQDQRYSIMSADDKLTDA